MEQPSTPTRTLPVSEVFCPVIRRPLPAPSPLPLCTPCPPCATCTAAKRLCTLIVRLDWQGYMRLTRDVDMEEEIEMRRLENGDPVGTSLPTTLNSHPSTSSPLLELLSCVPARAPASAPAPGRCVFDLSATRPPPARFEALGPPYRKQKHIVVTAVTHRLRPPSL